MTPVDNSDLTPGEMKSELEMMSNPFRWPQMVLPLKRKDDSGLSNELCVLSGVFGFETTVFMINALGEIGKLAPAIEALRMGIEPDIKVKKYDDYEAIYDDGWRVD